jgi:hypothetical protein
MVVFKYALTIADTIDVPMPAGARLLSVQVQNDVACVWALVDPDARKTTRRLALRGTGHDADGLTFAPFVGTFQLPSGFVGHLFDCGEVAR